MPVPVIFSAIRACSPVCLLLATALVFTGCKPKGAGGPGQMPPARVIAVAAVEQPVSETLSLVGDVAANEMVEIKSETDGTVLDISFKEGERVEKGRLLVRLDESKFEASVASGEASLKLSTANFERSRQLLGEKLISQQEFDQASSIYEANRAGVDLNKRLLKDARIFAPFAGVIGVRKVSPGQVINKNTTLTWIVDADPVKVEFNVPERFLSQVRTGQDIVITVAAYPGREFKGKVFFIAPFVDPQLRTALVKAEIPNPDHALKPGMFANLDLTVTIRAKAVVIPEVALTQLLDGGRALVFVVDAATNANLRPVKLGMRLAGQVEIVEGVAAGERVIVEGTQKVVPGKPVQLSPASEAAAYLSPGAKP